MPIYLGLLMSFLLFLVPLAVMLPERLRMAQRAKALLAQMPQHEQRTVYLAFASVWPSRKQKEINAKIHEEAKDGWTYLKANEASPLKTIRTWGGGVNLYFIREA
jgi:hypothetical protein